MAFIGARAILGECPIWDSRLESLFWVDIVARQVHRWDSRLDQLSSRAVAGRPGSIALTEDPNVLVVAMEHTLHTLDWETGQSTVMLDLPSGGDSVRLNDGRVDREGNLWVGSMHVPAPYRPDVGALYRVTPDWASREIVGGFGVANGLAFPFGESTMYFADSLAGMAWRYPIAEDGSLGDRETFVDFAAAELPGKPDGACVDAEGGYWVACVFGSAIARIAPDGRVDQVLRVPFQRPTCPTFGGPNLATLFVSSIGGGDYLPIFDDEPNAGRILALDVGVRGVPEGIFGVSTAA